MRGVTIVGLAVLLAGCGSGEPAAEATPSEAASTAAAPPVQINGATAEGPPEDSAIAGDWGASGDVASEWAVDTSAQAQEPAPELSEAPPPEDALWANAQ